MKISYINEKWTSKNIPDLTGRVIIVTGSNSGIGFEATKEFMRKGAKTILASRSMYKARIALNKIKASIPDALGEIMHLDLASQESVRQFASEFMEKYERLDILVNNAGIMMTPYSTTVDGFESQFATNYLGHFALTGLLLDLLLNTSGSRVVNVSSNAHLIGNMDFDNLMFEEGNSYTPMRAYARSKLANLLFTYELQRRYDEAGTNTLAVVAHPGLAKTNLGRYLQKKWYFKATTKVLGFIIQSAAIGALSIIRAAVDLNVKGGEYYGPDGFMGIKGYPVVVSSSQASHDKADAYELWEISKKLTGVSYPQLESKVS